MDAEISHALRLELARREILSCSNIEHMRNLTIRMLELVEHQRQWFIEQLKLR